MTRILVVEDEAMLRREVTEALEFADYTVLSAENGLVGLDLARRELPDLVISDIEMPIMDGFGLLIALREDDSTSAIPFIFLTAKREYTDVRRGMGHGADDYLVKPFDSRDLLTTVAARLTKLSVAERQTEQQLNRVRQSVVMSLPHELRTPLTGILGYLELMISSYEDFKPDQILQMLHNVQHSSARLNRLIQNYILYTQLEVIGVNPAHMERLKAFRDLPPSDPASIIPRAATERAIFYKREDDLHLNIEPVLLQILSEDLLKIVGELSDNALKFSDAGSPVTIEGTLNEGGYQLSVTDRGRGLRPDQVKNMSALIQFDRDRYEQQGLGFGLALVRRLTEMYGGSYAINSTLNEGTTVTVTLRVFPVVKPSG